jgi:predicted AAA+ superfamily ATPase
VLFLLKPHHQNFNKRLTKQPKLYFYDTGLAAYLLGIESSEILSRHFVRGPIFENYVASELIKFRFNKGMESNIYFWRDHHGREVDFVIDKGTRLDAIEVKSAATITKSFFEGLNYWNSLSPDSHQYLIYGGEMHQDRSQIKVLPWKSAQQVFD